MEVAAVAAAAAPIQHDDNGDKGKKRPAALALGLGATMGMGDSAPNSADSSRPSPNTAVAGVPSQSQGGGGLEMPNVDFLPRIAELVDLVAEANHVAAEDESEALRRTKLQEQVQVKVCGHGNVLVVDVSARLC